MDVRTGVQSNPKLGTSFGALAGYMHYFDAKSRPSIFAVTGQYSNTDSIVAGAFARTSFDEDHQRLIAGLMYGNIKNDYDDYLGTGVPLRTMPNCVRSSPATPTASRELVHRRAGHLSELRHCRRDAFDDQVLDILGVGPYKSGGLGPGGLARFARRREHADARLATQPQQHGLSGLAWRRGRLDVYRVDPVFRPAWQGHVFAVRQLNHLTHDAPTPAKRRSSFAATRSGSTRASSCPPSRARSGYGSGRNGRPRFSPAWLASTGKAKDCRPARTFIRLWARASNTS